MSEPNQTALIPTRYKGELAAKTSYPCGAQAFSQGLKSVPQFSLLTVSFWGPKPPSALLEAGPRLTVKFTYHQHPPTISTPDAGYHAEWRGPAWEIAVHPLLSRHRKLFATWLETEGFALASDWLKASWHFHGRDGKAAFEFHLDNATGLITQSTSAEVMPFR